MNGARLLRALFLMSALGFGLLVVYHYEHAIDHARVASYSYDLRQLSVFDARLNEELLSSRSGLVTHYDAISKSAEDVRRSLRKLLDTPRFLQGPQKSEVTSRLAGLAKVFVRKEIALEGFKSHNAVLRNSRAFAPLAAKRLFSSAEAGAALTRRAGEVLLGLSSAAAQRGEELDSAIERLEELAESNTGSSFAADLGVLLKHAKLVRARQSLVDKLVREALEVPFGKGASLLEASYSRAYTAALVAEARREKLLFALAMAVVACGLTEVILRVRKSARALEAATRKLSVVNQALAVEREKERELGDMKTRFVAMTSHEFRSPLSAVLSSSELLSRYGERWPLGKREEHLSRIRVAARQMSQLLDEILLIGTAEAGTLRPTPAPLNLDEQSQELVQTLSASIEHPCSIVRHLSGEPNVFLDERLLRHLLWNLLENAVKYSPPRGEVTLSVTVEPNTVRIAVRDAGIGIPAEDIPFLFTSFYRGRNVGKRVGSGLGLAVVKRVVDAQNGEIAVTSAVGSGTEFVVVLPHEAPYERAESA